MTTNNIFEIQKKITGPSICLHGPNACGKSDIGEILYPFFPGYEYFSTGDYAKNVLAANASMSIEKYVVYARDNNIPYDDILDGKLIDINMSGKPHIVDSRLGFRFIENSFNVYIITDTRIAAVRRYNQKMNDSTIPQDIKRTLSIESIEGNLIVRGDNDYLAYKKKYNVDIRSMSNYHFVIDNNRDHKQGIVADEIMKEYYNWRKKNNL